MHSLSDDTPHNLASIIAGNHDLTLDHDWYLSRGSRWHLTGLEVCLSLLIFMLSKLLSQNQTRIRGLLTPDESFTYLEYSSSDIETNGRTWKMFGSPVGWFSF